MLSLKKLLSEFVKNTGGMFTLGGEPFRFVGANVYELANVPGETAKLMIADADAAGFTVLRFWLFENRPAEEQVSRMNKICDAAKPYGIKLIVSLADKWGYLQNYKIDDHWFEAGFRQSYIPYIKTLGAALKDRDEIMMWELINEPESDSFDLFHNFVNEAAGEFKSADPNHMLTVGTVGGVGDKFGSVLSVFKKSNFRKLYELSSLDAVSLHDYSYDSGVFERMDMLYRFRGETEKAKRYSAIGAVIEKPFSAIDRFFMKKGKLFRFPLTLRWLWNIYNRGDRKFAKSISKPVYIGETGFKNIPGRSRAKLLELYLEEAFAAGAGGVMLWSFESQGGNRDGHDYGFGLGEGIEDVVKKWNERL